MIRYALRCSPEISHHTGPVGEMRYKAFNVYYNNPSLAELSEVYHTGVYSILLFPIKCETVS